MSQMGSLPEKVWLGFDIHTESGPILRPTKIQFWKDHEYKGLQPDEPFHFKADALTGLSLIHLNSSLKNPFSAPEMNFSFCHEAWRALEPHHELFQRSQPRVQALRQHLKDSPVEVASYFERTCTELIEESMHPWGVDLQHLTLIVESIDFLEQKLNTPLLYNFQLKFSKGFQEKIHYLHSLLFSLRSLIAMDYNSHIKDATHQAVKVDSITDYLSKAEYIANDALLYLQCRKLKEQMKPNVWSLVEKNFAQFSHNGMCLIENLPKSFLSKLRTEELEETLYIVQMDWLLGSDAGLLFRLREELYGLVEGYERIFYPELVGARYQASQELTVNCEVTVEDIYPDERVA